jgi:cytidylate kinase
MAEGRPVVIAVDGPAASGKGTLARRLARHFGYAYLDTGGLYRAVGICLIRAGGDPDDPVAAEAAARDLDPKRLEALLHDPGLRDETTGDAATRVAAIPGVRAALLAFQRDFARCPPGGAPGAVLDGRDIGTVICPDADYKIFIEADANVRADRRVKELRERGIEAIQARVLRDMKERDARDRGRSVAPLVPADDAYVLDSSALDADAAFATALAFIESRRKD